MQALLVRKAIGKIFYDYASGNIGTSAWVEIISLMPSNAAAIEVFHGFGSVVRLSTGAAGKEDASELPFYVFPGGNMIIIPTELSKRRLSARMVDRPATAGQLIINLYG